MGRRRGAPFTVVVPFSVAWHPTAAVAFVLRRALLPALLLDEVGQAMGGSRVTLEHADGQALLKGRQVPGSAAVRRSIRNAVA